jgi:CheY-like chemotaxis protein
MRAVLVSSDLMVVSRVQGAATAGAVSLFAVATAVAAIEIHRTESLDLVLVDLSAPSFQISELVDGLKSAGARAPRIVAFGPHVHEERLAAARAAGCDLVVSRGKFFSDVDRILVGLAN